MSVPTIPLFLYTSGKVLSGAGEEDGCSSPCLTSGDIPVIMNLSELEFGTNSSSSTGPHSGVIYI